MTKAEIVCSIKTLKKHLGYADTMTTKQYLNKYTKRELLDWLYTLSREC